MDLRDAIGIEPAYAALRHDLRKGRRPRELSPIVDGRPRLLASNTHREYRYYLNNGGLKVGIMRSERQRQADYRWRQRQRGLERVELQVPTGSKTAFQHLAEAVRSAEMPADDMNHSIWTLAETILKNEPLKNGSGQRQPVSQAAGTAAPDRKAKPPSESQIALAERIAEHFGHVLPKGAIEDQALMGEYLGEWKIKWNKRDKSKDSA